MIIKHLLPLFAVLFLTASCTSYDYPRDIKIGDELSRFQGESLAGQTFTLPTDVYGEPTILLFGFVKESQFDIDRWLIGLDMRNVNTRILEVPAIKGFFPRLISSQIDNGMRKGIPKELWSIVITVYEDGDKVQRMTGNKNPNNARVVVIEGTGKVIYFYDEGFSVAALSELLDALEPYENESSP